MLVFLLLQVHNLFLLIMLASCSVWFQVCHVVVTASTCVYLLWAFSGASLRCGELNRNCVHCRDSIGVCHVCVVPKVLVSLVRALW